MYYFIQILSITLSVKALSLDIGDYKINLQIIPNLNASTPRSSLPEKKNSHSDIPPVIYLKGGLRKKPVAIQPFKNDSSLWKNSEPVSSFSQDNSYSYSIYSSEYSSSGKTYETDDSLDTLWDGAGTVKIPHASQSTLLKDTTRSKKRKGRHHKRRKNKLIARQSNNHVKNLKRNHTRLKKPKNIYQSEVKGHDKKRLRKKHTSRLSKRPVESLKTNRIRKKDPLKIYIPENISLYIDNSHKILYNLSHYSPYLKPLPKKYDLNYLWSKQTIVKRFDESTLNEFSINQIQNQHNYNKNENAKISVFNKNSVILTDKMKHSTHNTSYPNKLKDESDVIFRQKISDGKKNVNLNFTDLLRLYLSLPELTKLQAISNPGKGKNTQLSISFPTNWIGKLKNVSEVAMEKPKNFILDFKNQTINTVQEMKNNTKKKIQEMKYNTTNTIQVMKYNVTNKLQGIKNNGTNSMGMFQGLKNKTNIAISYMKNGTQFGIQQIWQNQVQSKLDKGKEETGNTISYLIRKFKNVTSRPYLWQPWIHRVRDDVKVNSFINHIRNHNMKLFHIIAKRSTDKNWKKYIKTVAKSYEDKFGEYMAETEQHKIKSRKGTERVILNSIDVSNRIIVRLFNHVINDIDHNNVLRTSEIPGIIAKRISDETNSVLRQACSKLSVCKTSRKTFVDFVGNVMTAYSSFKESDFEDASYALIIAVQNTDFTNALGSDNDKGLKKQTRKFEESSYIFRRAAVNILKNIIMKRNAPLVVYGDRPVIGTVEGTVALLEFLDVLDEKVPDSAENVKTWQNIRTNFDKFVADPNYTNYNLMSDFVQHCKHVIEQVDSESRNKLQSHARNFL